MISDERVKEIAELAYEPVRIDSKSAIKDAMRLAFKFAKCAPDIAAICRELLERRETERSDHADR